MKMSDLINRIVLAHKNGNIDAETAKRAHAAIHEPTRYGSKMTPKHRDSILTHRFGI